MLLQWAAPRGREGHLLSQLGCQDKTRTENKRSALYESIKHHEAVIPTTGINPLSLIPAKHDSRVPQEAHVADIDRHRRLG